MRGADGSQPGAGCDWAGTASLSPGVEHGLRRARAEPIKCRPRARRGLKLSWDPRKSTAGLSFSDHRLPSCKKETEAQGKQNVSGFLMQTLRDPQLPESLSSSTQGPASVRRWVGGDQGQR